MGELSCKKMEFMIEELLDDRLDEPGRVALDEHLRRCPNCQGYRHAALHARETLGGQPLSSPSDRAIDRMWRALDRKLDQDDPRHSYRPRPLGLKVTPLRVAAGAALAASVAAVALGLPWLWPPERTEDLAQAVRETSSDPEPEERSPAEGPVERASGPALVLTRGDAEIRRADEPLGELEGGLRDGDEVRTADGAVAVLGRGDEIRLALGPQSALTLERLAPGALEVNLESGWLVGQVDPGEQALEVKVRTPAGVVFVLGTIFAVEVAASGSVEVRVTRGQVTFEMDGEEDEPAPETVSAGQVASFPSGQTVEVSPRVVGRDQALLEGRLMPRPAEVVVTTDVETLFEQAETARRGGQLRRAAALYTRIAATDPRGASGGTALISLGQLSLGPLGQPAQARQAFSSYLSSRRRSLRQEAFVGLLRAQRALGQMGPARRTARQYLDEYQSGRYRHVAEELLR